MPKYLATRISYFYCASALSGAFSGLLAAGIAQMDGVGGYEGWRWIFLLEGIATVILGISCFFLLIDTPALSTRWLTPEEIRYLEISMFIKQGGTFQQESGNKMRDVKKVLSNWRVYVQAYFLCCQSALSYGRSPVYRTRSHITDIHRYQIHASNHHKGNGLQLNHRPAHLCSSLRRRRHLSHLLCTTHGQILLANAIRHNSHVHRHDRLLGAHLSQRATR